MNQNYKNIIKSQRTLVDNFRNLVNSKREKELHLPIKSSRPNGSNLKNISNTRALNDNLKKKSIDHNNHVLNKYLTSTSKISTLKKHETVKIDYKPDVYKIIKQDNLVKYDDSTTILSNDVSYKTIKDVKKNDLPSGIDRKIKKYS